MHLLSITINEKKENVENIVEKLLSNYKSQEVSINSVIVENGTYQTIHFYIDDSLFANRKKSILNFVNYFKHYVAIVIADYIVDVLEIKMIDKILKNDYYFLNPTERKFILEQLNKFLEYEFYDKRVDVPYKVNRKAKILYKLMNFLDEEDAVNIDGFVKFRLQNYFEELIEILDKAIEEYMMEKEYKEFIKLLRYFVNIQEPKIELMNIVVDKEGKYHFYDENLKVINDRCLKDLAYDLADNNLSYDDLLISSLITIAPKKIVIHYINNIKNNEIIETIKNIFDERVYICNNCRICNLNKDIKEE